MMDIAGLEQQLNLIIKIYGNRNITYVKEILKFYNDEKELDLAENVLIGDLWETGDNCLNSKCGRQINPFYNKSILLNL